MCGVFKTFFTYLSRPTMATLAQTNSVSLGWGHLFGWPIANEGSVQETCLKTVLAILLGNTSGAEITHVTFNFSVLVRENIQKVHSIWLKPQLLHILCKSWHVWMQDACVSIEVCVHPDFLNHKFSAFNPLHQLCCLCGVCHIFPAIHLPAYLWQAGAVHQWPFLILILIFFLIIILVHWLFLFQISCSTLPKRSRCI